MLAAFGLKWRRARQSKDAAGGRSYHLEGIDWNSADEGAASTAARTQHRQNHEGETEVVRQMLPRCYPALRAACSPEFGWGVLSRITLLYLAKQAVYVCPFVGRDVETGLNDDLQRWPSRCALPCSVSCSSARLAHGR